MKLRALWLPLAAVAGIVIYILLVQSRETAKASAQETPVHGPEAIAQQMQAAKAGLPTAQPEQAPAAQAPGSPQRPLAELMPKTETVRAELSSDPHNTPPSLLKFAMTINTRYQEARKTEDGAKALFPELETCALNKAAAESVQAYCLLDAKRLSDSYSALGADFHSLESRADARALKIMKAMAF